MSGAAWFHDACQARPATASSRSEVEIRSIVDPAGTLFVRARSMDYAYQAADWRSRIAGIGGTAAVLLGFVAIGFLNVARIPAMIVAPQPLTVVSLERLEAPAESVRELPDGPKQIQRVASPQKSQDKPPNTDRPMLPVPGQSARQPSDQAAAAAPFTETTAPKSVLAPPANRAATNVQASWQTLLLAHLEKYRRYPAAARARGQEGVAQVTFRMNRQGRLLSSRVSRSSGSAILDRAAIDTLRRAQPLLAIPENMPAEIELTVDVEFFTR